MKLYYLLLILTAPDGSLQGYKIESGLTQWECITLHAVQSVVNPEFEFSCELEGA